MPLPADQDPFTLMSAAAEHVANGVPEVELEWWADPEDNDGTPQRRLTITLRSVDRWSRIQVAIDRSRQVAEDQHPAGRDEPAGWPDTIPDDLT